MDLLSVDEAAARVRISVRTLQRLIADGRGPALTRIGGRRFIGAEQLGRWVERNTAPADVQAA